MTTSSLTLVAIVLATVLATSCAHSFLTEPEPYTRNICKGLKCKACPEHPNSDMRNSPENPQVTWRRGENVTIRWAKNNHDGGFVRLALVPPAHRMDEATVARLSLVEGCFEQGRYRCEGELCGSDSTNRGFSRPFLVPNVVPDGVYALAFLWYGGIHFRRKVGLFSDYASCSYVRVQGGAPLGGVFQPFFDTGVVDDRFHSKPPGQCLTSSTSPDECKTGCDNKPVFFAVPDQFNGEMPVEIFPTTYFEYGIARNASDDEPEVAATSTPSTNPMESPSATASASTVPDPSSFNNPILEKSPSPSASASNYPLTTPSPSPSLSPSASVSSDPAAPASTSPSTEPTITPSFSAAPPAVPAPSGDDEADQGICSGRVCCASSCGSCGGPNCSTRPGGRTSCCFKWIASSDRFCDMFAAPCKKN